MKGRQIEATYQKLEWIQIKRSRTKIYNKRAVNGTLSRQKTVHLVFVVMETACNRVRLVDKRNVDSIIMKIIKCIFKEIRHYVISKNMKAEVHLH